MLRFEGDRDFRQPVAEVWARLTSAPFLISCIPDVEKVTHQEADRAELVLRPGFAFVRGTLNLTLQVLDAAPTTSARVQATSKGIGSSSKVEAQLSFAPQDEGCRVHWVAEVTELGGLLKLVPSGLIRGAAEKVLRDAWAMVEAKLAEPAA
jgi:carbon monoxide dehydrogenase subunit G